MRFCKVVFLAFLLLNLSELFSQGVNSSLAPNPDWQLRSKNDYDVNGTLTCTAATAGTRIWKDWKVAYTYLRCSNFCPIGPEYTLEPLIDDQFTVISSKSYVCPADSATVNGLPATACTQTSCQKFCCLWDTEVKNNCLQWCFQPCAGFIVRVNSRSYRFSQLTLGPNAGMCVLQSGQAVDNGLMRANTRIKCDCVQLGDGGDLKQCYDGGGNTHAANNWPPNDDGAPIISGPTVTGYGGIANFKLTFDKQYKDYRDCPVQCTIPGVDNPLGCKDY